MITTTAIVKGAAGVTTILTALLFIPDGWEWIKTDINEDLATKQYKLMAGLKTYDIRTDELAESKTTQAKRIERIKKVLQKLEHPSTPIEVEIRQDKEIELQQELEEFEKIKRQLEDANTIDRRLLAELVEQA